MFEPISVKDFVARTGIRTEKLAHSWGRAHTVVSLRELTSVEGIQFMPMTYLRQLMDSVVLQGPGHARVYENKKLLITEVSPRITKIGQTFIERPKYMALLEQFSQLLASFATQTGAMKLGPSIILGKRKDGTSAIAQYLPPIVEMNGKTSWGLLDGIHRNFLIERTSGTMPIIAVEAVEHPLPFDLHEWSSIRPVDEKPALEDRYFGLKPEYFRDLKFVGIDG